MNKRAKLRYFKNKVIEKKIFGKMKRLQVSFESFFVKNMIFLRTPTPL